MRLEMATFHVTTLTFGEATRYDRGHLVVSKALTETQKGAQTLSALQAVEGEARVAEIARMLGGERLSGTAHAQAMLGAQGKGRGKGSKETRERAR